MKKIYLILPLVLVTLLSCNDDSKKITIEKSKEKTVIRKPKSKLEALKTDLDALYSKHKTALTTYNIACKKQVIKAKNGIKIFFNPKNYIFENGYTKKDTIQIQFQTYLSKKDFILNGLQTISEKGLLESNGMFYIDIKYKEKPLKLKNNKSQLVQFPIKNDKEMYLYYKEKEDSKWTKSEQKLVVKKDFYKTNNVKKIDKSTDYSEIIGWIEEDNEVDNYDYYTELTESGIYTMKKNIKSSSTKERKRLKSVFYNINLKKLGWVNCDIFYKSENTNTTIQLNLENKTIDIAVAYLIFKDINSLVRTYIENDNNRDGKFNSIPINRNVKLIVFYTDGEDINYFEKEFKTTKTNNIPITLNKISEKEFIQKMNKL